MERFGSERRSFRKKGDSNDERKLTFGTLDGKFHAIRTALGNPDAIETSVTTCNRAIKAMDMLREDKSRFDIVLSDVYMPDMDGFRLLEMIGLELDIPVISTSETERLFLGTEVEGYARDERIC